MPKSYVAATQAKNVDIDREIPTTWFHMKYHILNGDALLQQFPPTLRGERIVARECLVDGPVAADSLEAFYAMRARFLNETYGPLPDPKLEPASSEFKKMEALPADAEVFLWFEDDLFCQVNMWFVCWLLTSQTAVSQFWLVRPTASLPYGFGGMSHADLEKAFADRQKLSPDDVQLFARLWQHYQAQAWPEMEKLAQQAGDHFPLLPAAVQAQLDRFPADGKPGRPERSLRAIMARLGSESFGPVFRAFHETEAIYGFGDLQVKRLFDAIKAENESAGGEK